MILTTTDDDSVEVSCEMRAFIHPDSSLIWEGPGGQRITGSSKHHITFTNGLPVEAADGSDLLVPSRVSTLTIFNPEPSDTGTYTCSVNNMGTNQTVTVVVSVNNGTTFNLTIIVGSVAAVIGLLTIAAIAALCFLKCVQNRILSRESSNNPIYDTPGPASTVPGLNGDDQPDQSVTTNRVEYMKENEAYGVAADGIVNEQNKAYGVATDGVSTTERNVAYGMATDCIDTMDLANANCDR